MSFEGDLHLHIGMDNLSLDEFPLKLIQLVAVSFVLSPMQTMRNSFCCIGSCLTVGNRQSFQTDLNHDDVLTLGPRALQHPRYDLSHAWQPRDQSIP